MDNNLSALLIIAAAALVTLATRAVPFLLFDRSQVVPKWITLLGHVFPPAAMSLLLLYCIRNIKIISSASHGIPELIAIAVAMILHYVKENTLLSIFASTVLYMFLVQTVFV